MRRGALGVAAVTTALCLAACAPSPPPDPLSPRPGSDVRLMTYNVLGAQADDRVFDEHGGIAARIDQLRPDIVVLQEAQSDDVVAIATRTHGYSIASYLQWACDTKPAPEGVAILVREASVSVVASGSAHVGSSCINPTVKRIVVWADLELPGGHLRVYGTHLTAGNGSAAESRANQIREIRSIIARDDPTGAGRWLLVGDVNTAPGAAAYDLIRMGDGSDPGLAMSDTFADVHPDSADPAICPTVSPADADGIAALLADPARMARCGYSAGWPKDDNFLGCDVLSWCVSWQQRRDLPVRERIDDVFRSTDGPVDVVDAFVPNRADEDWAAFGAEWFRLSDHLPTVVDLVVANA